MINEIQKPAESTPPAQSDKRRFDPQAFDRWLACSGQLLESAGVELAPVSQDAAPAEPPSLDQQVASSLRAAQRSHERGAAFIKGFFTLTGTVRR